MVGATQDMSAFKLQSVVIFFKTFITLLLVRQFGINLCLTGIGLLINNNNFGQWLEEINTNFCLLFTNQ